MNLNPCPRIRSAYQITGSLATFAGSFLVDIIREEIALRVATMPSRFYGER